MRVHTLKTFEERYGGAVRGRISAIAGLLHPDGAAIRHASAMLAAQPAGRRLLLLLTDGKPNDLDKLRGALRDRGHAPGGPGGTATGTAAVLCDHRCQGATTTCRTCSAMAAMS